MGFLNRFRSPEERERRAKEEAEGLAERAKAALAAEAQRQAAAAAEAERASLAAEAQQKAWVVECLGPDLAEMKVATKDDAKIAIKMGRLRKKELQAEKRELAAELADVREEWRERTAGRYSTVGLGRGTGGRMVRASVQGKRRAERQDHAAVVNEFSDEKQVIDKKILVVDKYILDLERWIATS